ncbi:signal transduction histidine kinase [Heliomicrobium modesticaldum Ice1]|uniref:Circadian input-output histidine kinase CikA n=1 Tax=Heliobacterium modesticaldum (strain ATCC 51547 / Ice1) TaxID=498761 RepID=B0TAT8_HELMI|nr:hybrid sensor histidine kinase/response regulator [Heliomicrobium modesticaldum]ABZ83740.1 signal transduction histidine kinase [Heliomicrobium modesticaldum Ice1]
MVRLDNPEQWKKTIIGYSTLGILAIGILIALVSIIPYYNHLQSDAEQQLIAALRSRTMVLEQFLSKCRDVTLQVTSRSQIKKSLSAYYHGEISRQELALYTAERLKEALNPEAGVIGITRFDRDKQALVQVGAALPQECPCVAEDNSGREAIHGPALIEGTPVLLVSAPITTATGDVLGYDTVIFRTDGLRHILEDKTGLGDTGGVLLARVQGEQGEWLFNLHEASTPSTFPIDTKDPVGATLLKASEGQSGLYNPHFVLAPHHIIAYGPIPDTCWVLLVMMSSDKFYAPIRVQTSLLAGVILGLIVLGVLAITLLLRLLTGKIIIHASEMEAEIRRKTLALEKELQERRQMQTALQLAKEEADVANRAKSAFLANMSHEIRTPMNAIIGIADLLWETPLNEEQKKFVHIFRDAGNNLLALINDILDLSKIESGKQVLQPVEFYLDNLVNDTIALFSTRAQEKGLELTVRLPDDIPRLLLGDVGALRQVLFNLLGNAIKFTETGAVSLHIEVADPVVSPSGATADPNPPHFPGQPVHLRFSVIDTGLGIPPEWQDRIFDSFTQVDASLTRRFGGTGLGLAICKRLVELMGGQIWVDSEPGKGSTFTFTACMVALPPPHLPPAVSVENRLPESAGSSEQAPEPDGRHRRETGAALPPTATKSR